MTILDTHVMVKPAWAEALVDVVRQAMSPLGFIGYLGYRIWDQGSLGNPYDGYMIAVFPTAHEWVGGSLDGGMVVSGFRLKLSRILEVFTRVEDVVWSCPAYYNGDLDGPEIVIEGLALGKRVLLRVYHLPPPDEPVPFIVDPVKGEAWARPEEVR